MEQLSEVGADGQKTWQAGYKPVLMADQVIIYAEGHQGFKIDLNLGRDTVCHLLKQALMLKPNDM